MKNLFSPKNNWFDRHLKVLPWPRGSFDIPSWQAHRGYWIEGEPENTLGALILAAQKGASMAEFDVRITRDSVPVLFHDETLKIDSKEVAVSALTLSELRDQASTPIHTLEQILSSDQVPRILNIELKSETTFENTVESLLERKVSEVIDKVSKSQGSELYRRLIFSSFNPFSLFKVSGFSPQIPRALLVWAEEKNPILRDMWWGVVGGIHALHLDHRLISPERMEIWKDKDLPIVAWTVNDQDRVQELYDLGVASIISDEKPANPK